MITYDEFLSSLTSGISIFINNIGLVANSLIHNYIFITFFGIVIFISLFHFLTDYLFDYIHSTRNNIEEEIDLYKRYKRLQLIKLKFLHKDRKIVYDINYLNHMIKQGVLREYISRHYYDYRNLKYINYGINQDVKNSYLKNNKLKYILNRSFEYSLNLTAVGLALKGKKITITSSQKKVPSWYGKEYDLNPPSDTERKEMDDIIKSF